MVIWVGVSAVQVQEVYGQNYIAGDESVHLICSGNVGDKVVQLLQ